MKSHYSQTVPNVSSAKVMFYYLMKSHYSQTSPKKCTIPSTFYYLMKSHYSQTADYILGFTNSFTTL